MLYGKAEEKEGAQGDSKKLSETKERKEGGKTEVIFMARLSYRYPHTCQLMHDRIAVLPEAQPLPVVVG